jgi:hypothetical protein
MRKTRSRHVSANHRSHLSLAAVLATAMLFAALTASASAMPLIGKDGKIHACYRVKGKPKGGLRVVPSAKTRCKRGERKVAWVTAGSSSQSAAGQPGSSGTSGGSGTSGAAGAQGAAGTSGSTAALSTQVGALTLKLEALENVLKGVDNGDLTGAVSKLNGLNNGDLTGAVDTVKGLSNLDLTEAVDTLPAVDLLCTQATELTKQANLLRSVFGGLGLEGVLGGLLKVPTLPAALPGFTCPS